jgi:uncharacterized membrane protein
MASVSGKTDPVVRRIAITDVAEALAAGLRDFQAAPLYGLMFGAIYAVGGLAIVLSVTVLGLSYLAYPLAAGFALIGPFVAIGLYQVSRDREAGRTASLRAIWASIRSRSELGWMAFVTLFIFIMWMYQARFLMAHLAFVSPRIVHAINSAAISGLKVTQLAKAAVPSWERQQRCVGISDRAD